MNRSTFLCLTFVLAAVVYSQDTRAQDYNRWSLPEGARMRLGKGDVRDVVWSPDRTLLAVGTSPGIWLYDARTGEEISLITGHSSRVNAVAFSPDGLTLASGSRDQSVRVRPSGVPCARFRRLMPVTARTAVPGTALRFD